MTGQEASADGGLVEAVRTLAALPIASPALIVATPDGAYAVSPDGTGGGARNRYVISRGQLNVVLWEHSIAAHELADAQVLARVAALVADYRPRSYGSC
jgi:hypothetical protein